METTKILLDENELPKRWYNIQADLPTPLDPPLNPQTKEPITPDDLEIAGSMMCDGSNIQIRLEV